MRRALVVLGVTAAVVLAYLRLYYGVDFTDEAFYVAIPYRFASGARPYVDEISVTQTTTGLLLTPLVWLWHAFAGRDGLVLFVRHVHFALALALGAAVFAALRRRIGDAAAAFVGVAAFLFSPFAIPSVSYDSLGAELFAAGCLLPGAAGGVCLGLAAFAYPPLAIGVLVACAFRRELRLVVPALALPAVGFVALAAVAGPGTIVRDYRGSAHYLGQAGGWRKVEGIAAHEWHTAGFWLHEPTSYTASLELVAHVAWLGLPLAFLLRGDRPARDVFRAAWVPGMVGGAVTAYSSANGGVNFGVGAFPAALATVVLAARAVYVRRPSLAYVPAALAAALVGLFSLAPVYRDAPLPQLDARVHGGPFAGLFTSARKRRFLTSLDRDLGGVSSRCRIAFFDDFPAGYLLTPAHVDTNALWTARVSAAKTDAYHRLLVAYWQAHGLPDVAVLIDRVPFAPPRTARIERYLLGDPLLTALRSYRRTQSQRDYAIYRRGACA